MTFTVALVGSRTNWQAGLDHPHDWQIPYGERPKVEVEADENEPLRAVLRRAASAFEIEPIPSDEGFDPWTWDDPAFIAFYHPERDAEFGQLRHEVTLLDENGHVRWTFDWLDEPVREYLKAGEAGILDGDPRRPYLLLQPGIGNGILVDWPTFIELWRLWWDIADKAAIVGGLLALREYLRRKPTVADDAPGVTESHYADWERNGARPDNFAAFLGQRPWHLEDLADAIGSTPAEAEALLIGFGHERNSAGLWVPGTSEPAKLLRGQAEFIIHAGMTTRRDAVEQVLRERLEGLERDGSTPPLDWSELGDLPEDLSRLPVVEQPPPLERLRENIEVVLRYRASSALHRLRRIRRRS